MLISTMAEHQVLYPPFSPAAPIIRATDNICNSCNKLLSYRVHEPATPLELYIFSLKHSPHHESNLHAFNGAYYYLTAFYRYMGRKFSVSVPSVQTCMLLRHWCYTAPSKYLQVLLCFKGSCMHTIH